MTPTAAIVDASVALKWVMPEPDSAKALALKASSLFAPDLLLTESANALWSATRRGLISATDARTRLDQILTSPIGLTAASALSKSALPLALTLDHPIYDCVYLALAIDLDIPLVTADQRFLKALRPHPAFSTRVMHLADLP